MLPLTSTLRRKQTQFESSSSNRGDVTSKSLNLPGAASLNFKAGGENGWLHRPFLPTEGAYFIERWPEERALGSRGPPTETFWLMPIAET